MKFVIAGVVMWMALMEGPPTKVPPMMEIGRGRISAVYDVKAHARYLYALERGLLHVLDARDPARLREVGAVKFARPRSRIALRYPYLYLTGFNEPLGIANVANPTRPVWIRDAAEFTRTANDGFELAGDYGYVVRNGEPTPAGSALTLDVLDLASDPARPKRAGTLDLGVRVSGEYGGIAYSSGRLFIVVSRAIGPPQRSRVIVVDTRQAAQPRIERTFFLPEGKLYRDVEVRGDIVYLLHAANAGGPAGLAIFRLPETGDLELLGDALTTELSFPIDLTVRDDVVYASFKAGGMLATFDVSNPRAPTITQTYRQRDAWAAGLGMAVVADRLYLAGDNGSSPIFDVSKARTPRLLGRYEFEGGSASAVLVEGGLAIVQSLSDLFLYDVTNPVAPRRIGRYHGIPSFDPGDFQFNVVVAASGSRVFVSYEARPSQLIDWSDRARPRVVATFTPHGVVQSSVLTPSYAALGYEENSSGTSRGGIEIVETQPTGGLRSVSTLQLDQPVGRLLLSRSRLVVAHPNGAVTIIDAQDWRHPRVVGKLAAIAPDAATDIALSDDGRTAYLTYADDKSPGRGVLTVLDLRDPTKPQRVGRLEIPISGSTAMPLAVRRSSVFIVAGVTGGIALVDASKPMQPRLTGIQALPAGYAESLAVSGRDVLIAAGEDGLLIYRRRTPSATVDTTAGDEHE